MACPNSTPNNRPVGIGYNTREEPTGLVELTTVTLSSVNATSGSFSSVYTNNVQTPNGATLVFNGVVSAVAYLGASGSGAANIVELGDVSIPALVSVPNEILAVNNSSQVVTSSMAAIIAEHQITTDDELAAELANYATNAALNGHTSNHTLSASLSDVNVATPTTGQVLAWNAATQRWVASSIPVGSGSGITDHGALTGLLDNDHPQYASSSVSALIVDVQDDIATHVGDSTIHFTSASLTGAFSQTSHSHSFSSHSNLSNLNANDHPQYASSSLSATISSHTNDSTIHFTSGSLSGAYSLLTHSHSYSSVSFLDLNDTPNNYSDPSVGSVPVVNAAKTALEFVPSSTFAGTGGTPGGSTTEVQFNNGGSFSGVPSLTWTQSNTTLSATYLRAVDITLGGSDGRIINNNGNIIISATGGTVQFPTGFSGASNFTTVGGVSANTVSATNFSGISLSGSLRDVLISNIADGHRLVWSVNRWINETPPDAGAGGIDELAGVNPVYTSPSSVSASFENGSPFIWEVSSISWAGKNLSSWVAQDLNRYLSGAYASSSVSANYSPTSHSHSFSSHGSLSNLNANDHPQYVLSATNSTLSSLVSDHIASSTVHFTSGSLSGAYSLLTHSHSFSSHGSLSNLGSNDHPQYVLSATNSSLSSLVDNHIGSAVHWDVATLNSNYLNSSGDSSNFGFYLSSVSASIVSATSYSGISLSSTLRDVQVSNPSNDQVLTWSATAQKWVPKTVTGGAGLSNAFAHVTDGTETYDAVGADTLGFESRDGSLAIDVDFDEDPPLVGTVNFAVVPGGIPHNSLANLTTGNPHTQYATLAGASFSGQLNASSLSATSYSGISLSSTLRDVQITSPTAGQLLGWNGSNWVASSIPAGGTGSPGGSTTQVQFNNGGSFSGSPELTWDSNSHTLSATILSAVNLNTKVISSIEEWKKVILTTEFTTTATAAGTSSTLSATLDRGYFYEVVGRLMVSSNTLTVGPRFGIQYVGSVMPASSFTVKYQAPTNVTTGLTTLSPSALANQVLATTAIPSINRAWLGTIDGTFELSGAGTWPISVLFNAETTGTVRLCAGSFIKFRKYSLLDP
jgi:hypothetical protein